MTRSTEVHRQGGRKGKTVGTCTRRSKGSHRMGKGRKVRETVTESGVDHRLVVGVLTGEGGATVY